MTKENQQIAICMAIAIAVATGMTFGVREWDRRHQAAIGLVDIADIMKAKEAQFTALMFKQGVTDEEKKSAFNQVGDFGNALSEILKKLPEECGCIVLNKAAYIAGASIDLTPGVKQRLGL